MTQWLLLVPNCPSPVGSSVTVIVAPAPATKVNDALEEFPPLSVAVIFKALVFIFDTN